MNKSTKKSLAFFLVVLCGVGLLNCKSSEVPQADQETIARVEQREAEFMQKRGDYIKEHGHAHPSEMRNGSALILKNSINVNTQEDASQESEPLQPTKTELYSEKE